MEDNRKITDELDEVVGGTPVNVKKSAEGYNACPYCGGRLEILR